MFFIELHRAMCDPCCTVEKIEELLVDGPDSMFGWTKLHYVIKYGKFQPDNKTLDVVQFLLHAGADLTAQNCFGQTPLQCALKQYPKVPILKLLVDHGADVNAMSKLGENALHCFLQYSFERNTDYDAFDVVQFLLNAGTDLSARNWLGHTPLHTALFSRCKKFSIIKLLLEKGALVHRVRMGPPLFKDVLTSCSPEIIEILIKYTLLEMPNVSTTGLKKIYANQSQQRKMAEACVNEIRRMDSDVVGENVTLRQFVCWKSWQELFPLHGRQIPEWFGQCDFNRIVEIMHDKERYPIYNEIIFHKVINQLGQLNLRDRLRQLKMFVISNEQGANRKTVTLNFHCVCNVVQYLTNEELLYLVAAFDAHAVDPESFDSPPSVNKSKKRSSSKRKSDRRVKSRRKQLKVSK